MIPTRAGSPGDLDADRLRAHVAARLAARAGDVVFTSSTASTNDDAKRAAAAGAPARSIFVADAQTAGRGRMGKVWHSPPGANLYLSILLRPDATPAQLPPFALLVGLAVAEEVDARLAAPRARVKWPNDVWVDARKIGGVLIEATIAAGRVSSLVVGIGVDVHTETFPDDLAGVATSLAILGAGRRDRAELAAGIAARVADADERFAAEGFAPFVAALRARDALAGRRVRVEGAVGRAEGIDDAGRLVVRGDDGAVTPIVAGHVELLADAVGS